MQPRAVGVALPAGEAITQLQQLIGAAGVAALITRPLQRKQCPMCTHAQVSSAHAACSTACEGTHMHHSMRWDTYAAQHATPPWCRACGTCSAACGSTHMHHSMRQHLHQGGEADVLGLAAGGRDCGGRQIIFDLDCVAGVQAHTKQVSNLVLAGHAILRRRGDLVGHRGVVTLREE